MAITIGIKPNLTAADTEIELLGQNEYPNINPETNAQDSAISQILGGKNWQYLGGYNQKDIYAIAAPIPNPHYTVELRPVAVNHQSWNNLLSKVSCDFEASLEDTVTIESSVQWDKSVSAGVSFTVGIEVGEGPIKASASTSYSLNVSVGESKTYSRSEAVGAGSKIGATLCPGEAALAALFLERGTLTVYPVFYYGWGGVVHINQHGVIHSITGEQLTKQGMYSPHPSIGATMTFDFDATATAQMIYVPDTTAKTIADTLTERGVYSELDTES